MQRVLCAAACAVLVSASSCFPVCFSCGAECEADDDCAPPETCNVIVGLCEAPAQEQPACDDDLDCRLSVPCTTDAECGPGCLDLDAIECPAGQQTARVCVDTEGGRCAELPSSTGTCPSGNDVSFSKLDATTLDGDPVEVCAIDAFCVDPGVSGAFCGQ